jgi:hypothetical protein
MRPLSFSLHPYVSVVTGKLRDRCSDRCAIDAEIGSLRRFASRGRRLFGKRETDGRSSRSPKSQPTMNDGWPRSGFSDLGNFRSRSWRERKAADWGSSSPTSQNRDVATRPPSFCLLNPMGHGAPAL